MAHLLAIIRQKTCRGRYIFKVRSGEPATLEEAHTYSTCIQTTPTKELPFAGHPMIGTAHLLEELDMTKRDRLLTLGALARAQPSPWAWSEWVIPHF
jgi:hypothetical protein